MVGQKKTNNLERSNKVIPGDWNHPGCLVLNCSQAEQVFIVGGIFSQGGAMTVQCPESQTRGFSVQSYLKSQDFQF